MLPLLPLLGGAASLIGGLFGHKGQKKAAEAQRQAQINALTLKQTMGEDKRLGALGLGSSILGGIHSQPGSRVNYSAAIDPNVLANLGQRRTYDFSKTVGDPNAGADYSFLGGLFGGAGNLLGEIDQAKRAEENGNDLSSSSPGGVPTVGLIPPTKYKFNSLEK